MHLRISASNVAALIGKNPYKKPTHVMYQMLSAQEPREFAEIKERLGRKTLDELATEAIRAQESLSADIQQGLQSVLKSPNQTVEIIQQTEAHLATQLSGVKHGALIAEALGSVIQTERGIHNENNVLDLYERETGSAVTERNTKTRSKVYTPTDNIC
jgi:hypothetical protein